MMVQKDVISGLDTLVKVAIKGLRSMFDSGTRMFCERSVKQGLTMKNEGRSYWETMNALLGLNEAYHYDLSIPLDTLALTRECVKQAELVQSIRDVGLQLWLIARSIPEELNDVYDRVALPDLLDRANASGRVTTKDLCLLLIGLSEIRLSDGDEPVYLDDLAYMTRQLLFVNYGGFGVFRSINRGTGLSKRRGEYGRFIDQALAIYAFTRYSRAFNDEHSIEIALDCARNMAQQQGEFGQWWSLYEVDGGAVARTYPIYAMHQDALAPLALFAITELTGEDFNEHVNLGIQWLYQRNELNLQFVNTSMGVIWEGVHDSKTKLYAEEGGVVVNLRPQRNKKKVLNTAFECRPSHLGWLLYALSGYLE